MTRDELAERAERLSGALDAEGLSYRDQAALCGGVFAACLCMMPVKERAAVLSAHLFSLNTLLMEAADAR